MRSNRHHTGLATLRIVMPGSTAATHLAYSAAIVAAMLYSIALAASFALREPSGEWLPD